MKIAISLAAAAAAVALSATPAFANSGNYSYSEYLGTCDGTYGPSCDGGAYFQNYIENSVCGCTGTVVNRWTGTSGNDRKRVEYDNNGGQISGPGHTYVEYVQNDSGNWKATGKRYCDDLGCISHGSMA